jgi:hypothetical protein
MNMINITEEVDKNKEEKYNSYIPEKVEEIINKKMHVILKHPDNTYNIEKTLEEYDNELYELSTNIVYGNYNIILSKLLKKYEEYSMEFSMCYNLEKTSIMYEVLTKEYCKFIKCYMKYDVENCNNNTENEEMIVFKMSSCMKKEEKKRYKNLTITIPVYVSPYKFNSISRRKSKKNELY